MMTREIRNHSTEDMPRVVINSDGSIDVYGYVDVVDRFESSCECCASNECDCMGEICDECGACLADDAGEGYDGLCGSCADAAEAAGAWS